jgi:hypothetical protein
LNQLDRLELDARRGGLSIVEEVPVVIGGLEVFTGYTGCIQEHQV